MKLEIKKLFIYWGSNKFGNELLIGVIHMGDLWAVESLKENFTWFDNKSIFDAKTYIIKDHLLFLEETDPSFFAIDIHNEK